MNGGRARSRRSIRSGTFTQWLGSKMGGLSARRTPKLSEWLSSPTVAECLRALRRSSESCSGLAGQAPSGSER